MLARGCLSWTESISCAESGSGRLASCQFTSRVEDTTLPPGVEGDVSGREANPIVRYGLTARVVGLRYGPRAAVSLEPLGPGIHSLTLHLAKMRLILGLRVVELRR